MLSRDCRNMRFRSFVLVFKGAYSTEHLFIEAVGKEWNCRSMLTCVISFSTSSKTSQSVEHSWTEETYKRDEKQLGDWRSIHRNGEFSDLALTIHPSIRRDGLRLVGIGYRGVITDFCVFVCHCG